MGLLRFFKKSADKKNRDEQSDHNAYYGQNHDPKQMQDYGNGDYRAQNSHFVREGQGSLSFFQQQQPSHNDPYFRGPSSQQPSHNAHHHQEGHFQGSPPLNYPLGSNHSQPYGQYQSPEQPHFQQRSPHPENTHQQYFHPEYSHQNGPNLAYPEKSPSMNQGYGSQKGHGQEPHFSASSPSHPSAPSHSGAPSHPSTSSHPSTPSHYSQEHRLSADQPSFNAAKGFSSQSGGATVHAFDKSAHQGPLSGLSHKGDYRGPSVGSQNLQQPVFTATAPALDRHPDVSSLFNASAANYSKSTNNTDLKELRFWDNGEVAEDATHQSVDDEDAEPQPLRFILALGILIIFAALAWLVFRWSTQSVSTMTPHIQADTEPYKVRPDNPGGLIVPHQDKLVYGRIGAEGNAGVDPNNAPVERLLPPPEQPMAQSYGQYPSAQMQQGSYPQQGPSVYNQQGQQEPHYSNQNQTVQQGAYPQHGNAMDNAQFSAPQQYPPQGQIGHAQGQHGQIDQSHYPSAQQGQHYPNGEMGYPQQAGAPMQQGAYGPQGASQGYNPNYPQQTGYAYPQNTQQAHANEGNGPYYPDTVPEQNTQARPVTTTPHPQSNSPQQQVQTQNGIVPTMPNKATTAPGPVEASGTALSKKQQAAAIHPSQDSQVQNQSLVSSGPGELPTGFLGAIPKNTASQHATNDTASDVSFFKARIAALETKAAAEKEWVRLRSKHTELFKNLNKSIVKETVNGKSMYVVQALGLQGEEVAKQFCKKVGNHCTYHKQ